MSVSLYSARSSESRIEMVTDRVGPNSVDRLVGADAKVGSQVDAQLDYLFRIKLHLVMLNITSLLPNPSPRRVIQNNFQASPIQNSWICHWFMLLSFYYPSFIYILNQFFCDNATEFYIISHGCLYSNCQLLFRYHVWNTSIFGFMRLKI